MKILWLTNFPIAKAHGSVTLTKLMGSRLQCSQVPCSESHFCLCSLTTTQKSAEVSPPKGRAPWLPRRQAWRPHLPAQRLPSPAPRACARKLASLIFRAVRSVSLFPRWSCWCTTGAAGSRSGTSWSTRLWPDGRQRRLCSGWSSLARGPLSTETGFYLKE